MASTVRAFWGPRSQAPEDGAACIVSTLRALATIDSALYGRWLLKGWTRRDAERSELSVDAAAVKAVLGRNRTDLDLGFSFDVWNGGKGDDAAEFSATFSVTSAHVRNVINVGVPHRVYHLAPKVLEVVRRNWQPDESDVWSPAH